MSELIKMKLRSDEPQINADAFIEPMAYHYLERIAQQKEMPLETLLVAQLAKNVQMADCIGTLYVLPQSTDVFLNEGPVVAYKTKQIFDPNYRERKRPPRSENNVRRGGIENAQKLCAWVQKHF